MNKHLVLLVSSLLFSLLYSAESSGVQAGDFFGPTPSGLIDKDVFFIGTDMKTPCKLCQIDCQQIPIFKNCANRYFNYGCHRQTPCSRLDTANPAEFHTAVAICLAFNKCEFTDVIDNAQSYDMYSPFAMDAVEDSVYKVLKLSSGRILTKIFNAIGAFFIDNSEFRKFEDKISAFCTSRGLDGGRECNFLRDTFARLKSKYQLLRNNISDDKWFLSKKSIEAMQLLQGYTIEDYTRVFRDEILSKVRPSLPPALNIYFKFAQDFKIQSTPDIADIQAMNKRLPNWFKDLIDYDNMNGADFYSTKILLQSVAMNDTRVDRLMNYVNQQAADNAVRMRALKTTFYDASAKLTNDWQSEYTRKNCARGFVNMGKSDRWFDVECPANNLRAQVKELIDNTFDDINRKYQAFLGQLAQETNTPIKAEARGEDVMWTNVRDVLFAVPLSLPASLQNAPASLPQDRTKISIQLPYKALGPVPTNYYEKGDAPGLRQTLAYSPPKEWTASHAATQPPAVIAATTPMCASGFFIGLLCPAWSYKIQAMYYAAWVYVPAQSAASVDVIVDDIGWIVVNKVESRAITSTNKVATFTLTSLPGVNAGQWNLFTFVAVNGKKEGKLSVQFKN